VDRSPAPESGRAYDAILLDLDGTLVDAEDGIHPRTRAALCAAVQRGVRVRIATGRSELATIPVLDDLGLSEPAVVFNGAGVWCPQKREFLEERVLSDRTLERAVRYGLDRGLLTVTMGAGCKHAVRPRNAVERLALSEMRGLSFAEPHELLGRRTMRVTLFSDGYASSQDFADDIERALAQPVYLTHFPLNVLPHHRESGLLVVDVHPPCRGKAEALRLLAEENGVPHERVVAVGDASNDVPMLVGAGLGVAIEGSMEEALAVADRTIGPPHTGALGELVEELFLL
jgi:Cof subfamily protein (haloacid dehalogenase superfamily)